MLQNTYFCAKKRSDKKCNTYSSQIQYIAEIHQILLSLTICQSS